MRIEELKENMKCQKCNWTKWGDFPQLERIHDEKLKCPWCDRIYTETIGGELLECVDVTEIDKEDYMEWQQ